MKKTTNILTQKKQSFILQQSDIAYFTYAIRCRDRGYNRRHFEVYTKKIKENCYL